MSETLVSHDTILFDGCPISAGQSFRPDSDHPDYEVIFLGIKGNTLHLADCCGTFTKEI